MIDYLINIFDNLRKKYIFFRFRFFELFDPIPKMNKDENVEHYVFRIKKRHALRYLNHFIDLITDYDVEQIDRLLLFEKDKLKRELLEAFKKISDMKFKYKIYKRQILEKE